MTGAFLPTVKVHRVELVLAVTIGLALTAWAVWVELGMANLHVPAGCFEAWQTAGPEGSGPCAGAVMAWGQILGGAGDDFRRVTEFMPFVVGSLVGVPIVAGELEARTSSLAWSLYPSRARWLAGQVLPVALVAGVAVAIAAAVAGVIEHDNDTFGGGFADPIHIGHYGYGFVARTFGTFGIAVAMGALIGRQLPALFVAVALSLVVLNAMVPVRDAWIGLHDTRVFAEGERGWTTGWAFIAPDGRLVSRQEGDALAPPDLVARDVGSAQPTNVSSWLQAHGYMEVSIGISIDDAMGWAPYEAAAYTTLGLLALGLAKILVNRRRPT